MIEAFGRFSARLVLLALPVVCPCAAMAQAGTFDCNTRLIDIVRLPSVQAVKTSPESVPMGKVLMDEQFGNFAPKSELGSVKFKVVFEPKVNPEVNPYTFGRLRLFVQMTDDDAPPQWKEVVDNPDPQPVVKSWDDLWEIGRLLQSGLDSTPEETDVDNHPYVDPSADRPGDPQLRIQQADSGVPVFMLKFIGYVPAGPYPDTRAETALVIDLRKGTLETPGAISCIVNDYPSLPHNSEFISCKWQRSRQDYLCRTDSASKHKGSFLLISGIRLRPPVKKTAKPK